MTLPKHIGSDPNDTPIPENRTAIAPYNFVPLPEKVVPAETPLPDHNRYYPEDGEKPRYTGHITCTLTTESPLYVRCGLTPEQLRQGLEAKDQPDFFYTLSPEHPVIPGSSLRGMLRTLVEIAAYGKMERVTKQSLVYRAVGDTTSLGERYRERLMREDRQKYYTPLMEAGYIEQKRGQWQIRPAQRISGTTFARIRIDAIPRGLERWGATRNASKIWIQLGSYDYKPVRGGFLHIRYANVQRASANPEPGLQSAILACSGRMFSKKHEAVIFAKDAAATPIDIPDWMVTAYREQISKEQQSLLGDNGALQQDQPVFYQVEDGELVFFGHPMMFRLPYRLSPYDFVPSRLRVEEPIDIAEAIFGYVRRDKQRSGEQALAGRIFVSDATLAAGQSNVLYDDPITPQILGSPKPTTFQHYLVQQSADKRQLKHYASKPGQETVIRGHKLYWHKGEIGLDAIRESDQAKINRAPKQYTQFRPVKPHTKFEFTIRFENLSQVELGALLWVLRIAADENYRLKLGMGKPLGMGAVKLVATVHLSDRTARYSSLFAGDGWATGECEMMEAVRNECMNAFEHYVLKHSGEQAKRLKDTLRMQCLMALLSWPGPDTVKTRYMEIERDENDSSIPAAKCRNGKCNEYSERPVLPLPLQVIGKSEQSDGSGVIQSRTQPSRKPQPKSSTAAKAPPSDPSQPIRFKGTVARKRGEAYVIEIKKNDLQRLPLNAKQRSYEIRLPVTEAPEPNMGKGAPVPMCIIDRIDDEDEIVWIKRAPSKEK